MSSAASIPSPTTSAKGPVIGPRLSDTFLPPLAPWPPMILQPDLLYYEGDRYVWSAEKCDEIWDYCFDLLEKLLQTGDYRRLFLTIGLPASGKSTWAARQQADDVLIFDSTFTDPQRRRRAATIAKGIGVHPIGVFLDTDLHTCLERNSHRPQTRQVPPGIIREMHARLINKPPHRSDGFTEIRMVR